MFEGMPVFVEVYPLAANEQAVFRLSRDAPWRSATQVWQDGDPLYEAAMLCDQHGAKNPSLLHSTSWRRHRSAIMLTYFAVVPVRTSNTSESPLAHPITLAILDNVGNTDPTAPAEPPMPTDLDVLVHGFRELRILAETDDTAGAPLREPPWPEHLSRLAPALDTLYRRQPQR